MPTQRKKKSETQFSDVGTFTKRKDGMTTLHSTKGNKTTVVAPSRMWKIIGITSLAGLAAAGIATGTYFGVTQSQKNSQGNGKDFNIKVNGSNILSEKDSVVSVVAHNASNVQWNYLIPKSVDGLINVEQNKHDNVLTFLAKEDILLNKDDTITISATSDNVTKTTSISLENPYLDEIPTNWKIQEKGTMIVGQDILATMTHVEMSNKATHTAMLTRNQKCNYEIYKDEQGVEQLIISGIDKVQKFNGQTVTTEEVAFQMKISDLASTSNMQTVYYQHNFEEFTKNALPFANFNPATPQHTK